jgi:hypothetical protein
MAGEKAIPPFSPAGYPHEPGVMAGEKAIPLQIAIAPFLTRGISICIIHLCKGIATRAQAVMMGEG